MQTDLTAEGITFNDLPAAMSKMLNKVERLEVTLTSIREDIRKSNSKANTSEHVPMSTDEVSQFLGSRNRRFTIMYRMGSYPLYVEERTASSSKTRFLNGWNEDVKRLFPLPLMKLTLHWESEPGANNHRREQKLYSL